MHAAVREALSRWQAAGLIDAEVARRLEAFEADPSPGADRRLNLLGLLLLFLGGLLMAAGTLLFVASHWDRLSPAARFLTLAALLTAFHGAGAFLATRSPRLARTLHGLGTLALGAGIFLAGQIFHLEEHWPGGVLLWTLGALLGWALLRDWVQGTLLALLAPAWLCCEWIAFAEGHGIHGDEVGRVLCLPLLALALTYLTARQGAEGTPHQRALAWVGGLALFPLAIPALALSHLQPLPVHTLPRNLSPWTLEAALALGLLLATAAALPLRGRTAGWNGLALAWVAPLGFVQFGSWTIYAWAGLGCAGLLAWGLHEDRPERLNLGMAGFALTIFTFYAAQVMDRLGRSLGLLGLGLVFLAGGWQLERLRRRLRAHIQGGAS